MVPLICIRSFGQSTVTDFKAGSLIVPMDNARQGLAPGLAFNVKAYGLVNLLLQNNIPVHWAIADGKAKDGADFSVVAARTYPSAAAASTQNFSAGPFIIDSLWAAKATPIIAAYGSNVAVYTAQVAFQAPVRYELMFRPKIAVFTNGNSQLIHTKALRLAGFTSPAHFDSIPAQNINAVACYTFASEPHWDSGSGSVAGYVTSFINSGGNFFAQCAGAKAYEDTEHYHTTSGLTHETIPANKNNTNVYPVTAHPLTQFNGQLVNNPTGTVVNFKNNGGSYQPATEFLIKKDTLPASGILNGDVVLSSRKVGSAASGGIVSYFGGHDYLKSASDPGEFARAGDVTWNNGLRIFYNAIFMPPTRPAACNFVFASEVAVNSTIDNSQPCVGDALEYTVTITGNGPGTANDVVVQTVIPAGLTFVGASAAQGAFDNGTGIWTVGDIPSGGNLSLVLTYTVSAGGIFNFEAYNADLVAGNDLSNDTTSLTAVGDTVSPTITAPPAQSVGTNSGCTATGVALGTPTTADNCSVASVTSDAPAAFPLGTTTVTWTVTDNAGNTATAQQTVTVTDDVDPTITAPADISATTNSGCTATGVALGTPTTADNCGVASTTNDAPAAFSLGSTTVTWTVTDNAGNTATAQQTVTVTDDVDPTITAPADVNTTTNFGCTATGVALGTSTTGDNCGVASVTSDAPAAFPLGTTTVTWTVTDNAGNTATAQQTVTVTDDVDPTITAPADVNTTTNSGCTATGVALGTPTTADNCGVASTTNDAPAAFPLGSTTVTWTVTDNSGNTATAQQTVTVTDDVDPTITAPADVNATTNSGCTATGVALGTSTTADNCGVASTTNDAPAAFPLGSTTVTWTVTDNAGNTATAQQTVIVTDDVDPTITAPADVNTTTNSGCTATGVALGTSTTADNCGVASTTNDAPAAFPLGSTTVTWTVTDNAGNTATAQQTVTVTDDVDPTITAPADVNTTTNSGCTATGVALGTPTTADNCGVASTTNDAPAAFPLGSTTVTWTVTDNAGNTATAQQTVTVTDDVDPTITAPADINATTNSGCTATGVALGTPTTGDNCGVASVTSDAPAAFPLGTTTVTWTVTDNAGNTATAQQTVTVTDDVDPTITAPADVNATTNSGCTATGVALGTPVTGDNCGVASVTSDAPAAFPLGTTTVTWTVTDNFGNTATAQQTVTVTDDVDPTITAPADVNTTTNFGCTATGVALGTSTTGDNCGVASVTSDAPAAFPLGTTTVTWTVTDNAGNTATAQQTVTVTDDVDPTITAPADINATTNSGCTATGVALGTPITADNCSVASVTSDAPAVFPLGTTTVTWTVTDNAGNTATAQQTVTVTDDVDPTITAPADVNTTTNSGCTATGVALGTPTTADNCGVASTTNDAPAAFPLGSTTVTWTVTDNAGNTATAQQTVTVTDDVDPTITAPADVNATTNSGCTATGVVLGTPMTGDNCGVASVISDAPADFPLGTTTVTWTVTDNAGNTATAQQTVTVTDDVDPTITAPADINATTNSGCTATGVALGTPITADNCSVASVTSDAPAVFPLGTTTVTWTVADNSGNTETAQQSVTVADVDPPVIAGCGDTLISCTTTVTFNDPQAADNCEVAAFGRSDLTGLQSGDIFPEGYTTLEYTATDGSGNTTVCTKTIQVVIVTAPANAGNDQTVFLPQAQLSASTDQSTDGIWEIVSGSGSFGDPESPVTMVYNLEQGVSAYSWTVVQNGCPGSADTVHITYLPLAVPNGFSPDGDHVNDRFEITGLESFSPVELVVLNRWGAAVYESDDYQNDWDGTDAGGQALSDDTYYYKMTLNDHTELSGFLMLKRR